MSIASAVELRSVSAAEFPTRGHSVGLASSASRTGAGPEEARAGVRHGAASLGNLVQARVSALNLEATRRPREADRLGVVGARCEVPDRRTEFVGDVGRCDALHSSVSF